MLAKGKMLKISIVIPTYNEAIYLPKLLFALQHQSRQPDEMIVADAGSTDNTVQIARAAGCRVVAGGRPARGRNAGAAVSSGDLLVFLDADVIPPNEFIQTTSDEFEKRRLDAATCLVKPISRKVSDEILHQVSNVFLLATSPVNPHAGGFCIFSRREAHEAIHGFDETLYLSEDHDYVRRVASHGGRFGILHKPIPVSVRRLDSDGRMNVAVRYTFLAINQLAGDPIDPCALDSVLGPYRFGHHSQPTDRRG